MFEALRRLGLPRASTVSLVALSMLLSDNVPNIYLASREYYSVELSVFIFRENQ